MTTTYYHGSDAPRTLEDARKRGLFVHFDRAVALSHGPVVTEFEVDDEDVLSHYALNYEIDAAQIELIEGVLLREIADGADVERAWAIVVESRGCVGAEEELEMFRADDAAESGWEAQRIRGCVARALGYRAVEIEDEHGGSSKILVG